MFTIVQSKRNSKKASKKTTTTNVEPPVAPKTVQTNVFNCLDTESDTEDSVKIEPKKDSRVLAHRKKLWSEWESDDEDD
jgi:hypothetical protein